MTKAVILAAGMAMRLRPLTENSPKCLLNAGSMSILERTIDNLLSNEISDIVIVTGYLGDMIRDFISEKYPSLEIKYCHNSLYDSTNNIYSLWLARHEFDGHEMLLLDSDIVFDGRIIGALLSSGHDSCLALKNHKVAEEEIKVRTDSTGRVIEISKEVDPGLAAGESVGIELFSKDMTRVLFSAIDRLVSKEKRTNIFYEVAFQELADAGHNIFIVDISGYFCMEIDTADDLHHASELVEGKLKQ